MYDQLTTLVIGLKKVQKKNISSTNIDLYMESGPWISTAFDSLQPNCKIPSKSAVNTQHIVCRGVVVDFIKL